MACGPVVNLANPFLPVRPTPPPTLPTPPPPTHQTPHHPRRPSHLPNPLPHPTVKNPNPSTEEKEKRPPPPPLPVVENRGRFVIRCKGIVSMLSHRPKKTVTTHCRFAKGIGKTRAATNHTRTCCFVKIVSWPPPNSARIVAITVK